MIYLDSSAALKAVVDEEGSDHVRSLLAEPPGAVSSRLLAVELHATAHRRGLDHDSIERVLRRVALVSLDDDVCDRAVALRSGLRSLDALHLATAVGLAELLAGFACFDRELGRAAEAAGLAVLGRLRGQVRSRHSRARMP